MLMEDSVATVQKFPTAGPVMTKSPVQNAKKGILFIITSAKTVM